MTTATPTRRRYRRPKMTATEARTFERYSMTSMVQIAEAIEERRAEGVHPECSCEPYADTFTFNRWKAQGFGVRKGEKAIKFVTWVRADNGRDVEAEAEADDDRREPALIMRTVCVFCRCQVEERS